MHSRQNLTIASVYCAGWVRRWSTWFDPRKKHSRTQDSGCAHPHAPCHLRSACTCARTSAAGTSGSLSLNRKSDRGSVHAAPLLRPPHGPAAAPTAAAKSAAVAVRLRRIQRAFHGRAMCAALAAVPSGVSSGTRYTGRCGRSARGSRPTAAAVAACAQRAGLACTGAESCATPRMRRRSSAAPYVFVFAYL